MKKFKFSIIHRLGILILTLTVLGIGVDNYNFTVQKEVGKLEQLHKKLGVIKIEPLNSHGESRFLDLIKASTINTKLEKNNYKEILVQYDKDDTNTYILKIDSDLTEEKLAKIYANSASIVKETEPNYLIELNSETIKKPVKLEDLKSTPHSFIKPKATVAIIDSGIDTSHTKLKTHIVDYANFASDSITNADLVGHGTHVAGIILNEAPNTNIVAIKFTDGRLGRLSDLLKSIDYAVDKEVQIINLSLGIAENSKFLETKINDAIDKNILVVAAAGNQNSEQKFYPAAFEGVISVGALNSQGEKMFSSNYGDWVDFAVIGQDIYSTFPNNSYKYWSGTSQAAAKLTGMIIANTVDNEFTKTVDNLEKISKKTTVGKIIDEDTLMSLASAN